MKDRRLIESRLPLKEISEASTKEKNIRHGHISTLHIWWARRPLAASRAAVFGTLVPDTDDNYELVKKIVPWDAVKEGNNSDVEKARRLVLEANGGKPPRVLDPFSGGGAIPLEALRLGAETYAMDLNPVAYLILKATLEYPQKFGQPGSRPVPEYIKDKDRQEENEAAQTPRSGKRQALLKGEGSWEASYKKNPLTTDVRYWGEWVLERAREELAEFYPPDPDGKTPVAYLWARTVTCTNPACRAEVPLVRQWWLAKKKNKRIALKPIVDQEQKKVDFEVVEVSEHETWPDKGAIRRGNAVCPVCGATVENSSIRQQGISGEMGQRLLAVVLTSENARGKTYRQPTHTDLEVFKKVKTTFNLVIKKYENLFAIGAQELSPLPDEPINIADRRNFWVGEYGPSKWGDLFNPRQALALVTFAKWVREAQDEVLRATGDEEYARAVGTYLGIAVDRISDRLSTLAHWDNTSESIMNTFARQALPMVWDYLEAIPIADSTGGWSGAMDWILRVIAHSSGTANKPAHVHRASAARLPFEDSFFDAIATDPPYYDAVPYADLSDFFYVWLRRTVGHLYPEHFRTPLTPKGQEIVQNPVRHQGDNEKAKQFFEDMMARAFSEMHRVLKPEGRATIVFAHKSTEAWETLINALIGAGFTVEASWPIHTEMKTRLRARKSAALASSTFMACVKRNGAGVGYLNRVREEMEQAISPRLEQFWEAGITGADFFMSAIGPGLEAFSRYEEVRRMSGEPVSVGEFLDEVRRIVLNFVLGRIFGNGGRQSALDGPTQFALSALWAYGLEMPSDEARKLAQGAGIELGELGSLLEIKGENAKLRTATQRNKVDPDFGDPETAGRIPIVDAIQRSMLLLPSGRQAIADYLDKAGHYGSESFWMAAQAFAEVLRDINENESRALQELLVYRDNLPQPRGASSE